MSESPIWDNLPLYPEPADIEALLAETAMPQEFSYAKAALMYEAAESGSATLYTTLAESLFQEAPSINLVAETMKTIHVALEEKRRSEDEHLRITVSFYQQIIDDLFSRVRAWTSEKYRTVFMHHALNAAAEFDDVTVIITHSFLEGPIYTSTAAGSTDVLALLLDALFNATHKSDLARVATLLDRPPMDHLINVQLYIHKISIVTEALSLVTNEVRDKAITILLLPRYNHYIGDCETHDYKNPSMAFEERVISIWDTWGVHPMYSIVSNMRADEGPGCLYSALKRCVELYPQIQWDEMGREWVFVENPFDAGS
ncbi:uncharacterized protein BDV17DRAFT_289938 [Aspergillus undulatus]|uniref:uncharacterized protein n=1 Tax=Aspergillus undulatus TaxID=1810928 RepID=UPI003CCCEC44